MTSAPKFHLYLSRRRNANGKWIYKYLRSRDDALKYYENHKRKVGLEAMRIYARKQYWKIRSDPERYERMKATKRNWWNNVYVPRREADREIWADVRNEIIAQHRAKRS